MKETFIETKVTYTLELEGKLYVVENVPARVCRETGEQLFSPETVGQLQRTIWGKKKPKRVIETPVYEYSQLADAG
jgi:YgiT-type zinc finger domain-containing protein